MTPPDTPSLAAPLGEPAPPTRRQPPMWLIVALVAVAVGFAGGGGYALLSSLGGDEPQPVSAPQRVDPSLCVLCDLPVMSDAWLTGCYVPADEYASADVELSSDSKTLTIEGAYQSVLGDYSYVDCLLDRVRMPDDARFRLDSTRALDGMQDAEWTYDEDARMEASWTYHPDDGLNMVISEVD